MYTKYGRDEFKSVVLAYLKTTDVETSRDYGWYALYFLSDYYNTIIDEELALEVLEQGKKDLENRIETGDYTEDEHLNLFMNRCHVLWVTGVYYFDNDDLEKGGYYFDLANENPDCEWAFPGTTEEHRAELDRKYATYKSTSDER
jgi:hypothetical protein